MNWQTTLNLIPDGVQTLSKMPSKYVNGIYPKYIVSGDGAYVEGDNGKKYVDYTCSLGAILLGHNYSAVNQAITSRLTKGILFGLPNYLETELAEKIKEHFPIEMMRFLKTGSEACQAAIRIARAYTNREIIYYCGYHGWHSWYNAATPKNKGTLAQEGYLCRPFTYNDIKSIEDKLKAKNVAAVILEPYIYDAPQNNFLVNLKNLCTENGTVLIFDEVVTGFRTEKWCAANMFKVQPDLMCLGKAMANGLPISVVGGRRDLMEVLKGDCFVSSTFGGELLSIVAALAVIKEIEEKAVIEAIWHHGELFKTAFNDFAEGMTETKCIGYPCRTFFKFPTLEHKSLFWQECLEAGVLFGYAQFINFAHRRMELDITLSAMRRGLTILKKNWDEPIKALKGRPAEETLRLIVTKNGTS